MFSSLDPKVIAEIKRLQFQTKKLVDQGISGQYRSAFRGLGIEFEEVREYFPGDDTRAIDWKVTARHQKPFIKSFREERELTVCIAVDISASTLCGTKSNVREYLIAKVGAILTLIAKNNNDKVGLLTFSSCVESYYPPRKAKHAVSRILTEVLSPKRTQDATNLGIACKHLSKVLKKHSIIFIISDFLDAHYEKEMSALSNKHEVCAIVVHDESDLELPNVGLLKIIDQETKQSILLDTNNPKTRKLYKEQAKLKREVRNDYFKRSAIDFLEITNENEVINQLRRYFTKRKTKHRGRTV